MSPLVFLGGTVGQSKWRESFTRRLIDAGVPAGRIYNPVVPEWTPDCQEREAVAKREAEHLLFYLCDPASGYSLVEATMGLYDRMKSTVVVFDLDEIQGHGLQSLRKCEHDLRARFPEGNIFSTADEALGYFASLIAGVRAKTGTGGLS